MLTLFKKLASLLKTKSRIDVLEYYRYAWDKEDHTILCINGIEYKTTIDLQKNSLYAGCKIEHRPYYTYEMGYPCGNETKFVRLVT
jgi:hypothetical protein